METEGNKLGVAIQKTNTREKRKASIEALKGDHKFILLESLNICVCAATHSLYLFVV